MHISSVFNELEVKILSIDYNLLPFYRFAAENVSVGLHAVNELGQTILYNHKMKEIEGVDFEDLSDRTILELFQFDQQESTLMKVLQSGIPILNSKQTYWNRNGQEITTINDTYPVFDDDKLIGAIELARDITALEKLVYQPLRKYGEPTTFAAIIAESEPMRIVIETAKKAAAARLPVLLTGEAGTGKDLLAEAIHYELSPSNSHFYTLYCHSSEPALIQNFYNDLQDIQSVTVFCERIDLLSLPLQKQLHKLLSDKRHSDKLFIASIGSDPVELIATGELLKELYYFFASMIISVPSLKDRKEDIDAFVEDYFERHRKRLGSSVRGITPEIREVFHEYDWPGNLKEVEILLDEVSSMITTEEWVTYDMLPLHFKKKVQEWREPVSNPLDFIVQMEKDLLPLDEYLKQTEVYYLQKVLNMYDGNITKAANALGMSRQNLQYRLRKLRK